MKVPPDERLEELEGRVSVLESRASATDARQARSELLLMEMQAQQREEHRELMRSQTAVLKKLEQLVELMQPKVVVSGG